jgi:acyl-CoA thioesterase
MKGTDYFREHLGVKVIDAKDGYAKVSMKIAKEHTNSVGMTHGGVVFALADFAFAEAVNFGEKQAVAVQVSINFIKPSYEGDVLTAEAIRISEGKKFALCDVKINKENKLIASFSGLAYKL